MWLLAECTVHVEMSGGGGGARRKQERGSVSYSEVRTEVKVKNLL